MWKIVMFACSLVCLVEPKNIPRNDTAPAVTISKYSKVARWGAAESEPSKTPEGRSSSGQALWAHRSDVNIVGSQGVKIDSRGPYRFSLKASTKVVDDKKVEKIPAVGEVVQDRFNPRPYFAYGQIPAKSDTTATYAPAKQMPDTPSVSTDFDTFPAVFNVAPSTAKSVDPYTSPYSSYNPPPLKPDDTPISDSYPPTNQDYPAPASMDDYKPPSYVSVGPPLVYRPQDDDMAPDGGQEVDAPPSDYMQSHGDGGPPQHPPKSEDDVYYPPDVHGNGHDLVLDHPPKNYNPPDMEMPPDMGGAPDMGMGMDHDMPDSGMDMGSDMTMDLAPPPSNGYGHFPQYLYDGHHYDNHVYEEVPHTTEGKEDKRVSSGHYSYYYLGRKLWYIPLYFSIYFIIYVTVLILKAIARHKIQYKHKWAGASRSARKIDTDRSVVIDELHRNVDAGIHKASKMYATFAM